MYSIASGGGDRSWCLIVCFLGGVASWIVFGILNESWVDIVESSSNRDLDLFLDDGGGGCENFGDHGLCVCPKVSSSFE